MLGYKPARDRDHDSTSNQVEFYFLYFYFIFRHAVHGGWSNWSNWTECSVTCGSGVVTRKRHCNNPVPAAGDRDCNGTHKESKSCRTGELCIGRC